MDSKAGEEKNKKIKDQIEKKHGKSVEQLRAEREKRVNDAMTLQMPDRVPVTVGTGVFAAKYGGLQPSAMYYDHAAYREACKKMLLDFEPDNGAMGVGSSGKVLEMLDSRQYRWPGGNLPADGTYQFVEGEYMKADEYKAFLADPADFIVRRYLPRTYGTLQPLEEIPAFKQLVGVNELADILGMLFRPDFYVVINFLESLKVPGLKKTLDLLKRVIEEQQRLGKISMEFGKEMAGLGFPGGDGGGGGRSGAMFAPFDSISDRLRGMRGTMLDMFRCPDDLLTACDKILEWEMAAATPVKPGPRGYAPRSGMPLHRGSDGFMSLKDFEKFYWPTLKKAIEAKVKLGYIATPFFEGIWDSRLEYLLELPRGRVVFQCEKTDLFKAKKIIGNHMCIQGGVPPTILQAGSPQDVEEYCKKLIKEVGKGGGFILSCGSATDYAKPENMKAMVDSVNKYGWY